MCGIAGIFSLHPITNGADQARAMNDAQVHRGPDGEGLWQSKEGHVHLAHRRLSIIDLSEAGAQPMSSTDGRYILVYNGEIYNYQDLKQQCIAKNSQFHSQTDSEVIIEYIRHFGTNGIKDFRGMWAFALYDTAENTVIMSRDPFGIKPLHYGIKDGCLYFASEIKSLRVADPYFNAPDEDTAQIFLDYGLLDLGDWTFFEHVKRFPHAHTAVIDLNANALSLTPERYWSPPTDRLDMTKDEAISRLRDLLKQSITRHLRSDVPLAFCLSGGMDSSAIVALASEKRGDDQALNTFTTTYPDFPAIDETRWAKMVNARCQTDPHFVAPTYEDFKNGFEAVLYHHDEPFGSTSIYAQNAIFKAIHDAGLKVSLDGQGADEILGGYPSYFYHLMRISMQDKKPLEALRALLHAVRQNPAMLKDGLRRLPPYIIKRLKMNKTHVTHRSKRLQTYQTRFNSFQDFLNEQLCEQSIPTLLRNSDRSAMQYSVESRVPFLDVDLVEFIIRLPDHFKINRGVTKYILRESMRGILPDSIIDRRDKLGFPAPEKFWLSKAYDMKVSGSFTKDWRVFILQRWREMIAR